ncbi:LANO_0F02828g1_1 [Lachancea nothofagi CBS 11611]|uniref:LANO_0F02828g1_1 n=1 Tax=Lachancea nothofagi CBS 11611 TaxID=1266666 RepID=A0A1G4K6X6_9SACH|nr:LANO_0F02828g1_1 [Lachancea nothofagi CBS 11611]
MKDTSSQAQNTTNTSRHASIVEMLSTPPAMPQQPSTPLEFESISLSRNASASSLDSQMSSTTSCLTKVHSQKWQHIPLSQLIEQNKLVTVEASLSVEEAFNTLVRHNLTSLPVEQFPGDINCFTFDYNDLNSYLLLVLNKIQVNDPEIARDCQMGKPVPVGEIVKLTPKNQFHKLREIDNLTTAMGILGSGVHRVAITDSGSTQIKGILSQRRLIKYLWDNARQFSNLQPLLNSSLQDLGIGVLDSQTAPTSRQSRVISMQGEEHLMMALYKMHTERISSIAVVDNHGNLLGNISVTDVRHVTRTSQYPLLHNTCRHFISVILNSRGLEMGKDSFPIFHVYPSSSLARTLAKLVATKAHRLWIVQPENSATSTSSSSMISGSPQSVSMNTHNSGSDHDTPNRAGSPISVKSFEENSSQTATPLFEKEYRTGKLIGVVSLTDILGLLARRQTEHKQVDPQSARRQRGSVGV